jgi:hypothetical protein
LAGPGPAAPSTGGNSAQRDQNVRNYAESPIKSFPINPTKVPPLWVKPGGRVALVAMGNLTRKGFHVQFDKQLAPEDAARFIFGKETVPSGWKIDSYPDACHIWRVEREDRLDAWEGSKDLNPEVRRELTTAQPMDDLLAEIDRVRALKADDAAAGVTSSKGAAAGERLGALLKEMKRRIDDDARSNGRPMLPRDLATPAGSDPDLEGLPDAAEVLGEGATIDNRGEHLINIGGVFHLLPGQRHVEDTGAFGRGIAPAWRGDHHSGKGGFEVTLRGDGGRNVLNGPALKTFFFEREQVDWEGKNAEDYRYERVPVGRYTVLVPTRITPISAPQIWREILLVDGWNQERVAAIEALFHAVTAPIGFAGLGKLPRVGGLPKAAPVRVPRGKLPPVRIGVHAPRTKVVGLLDDVARNELWGLDPKRRGMLIEDHLAVTDYKDWWRIGKERGGTFELFDFQKGRDIVSLKTAKTSGKGWVSDMKAHLKELELRSIKVNGEPANKILDLRINPGGRKEASESLLELIELGRKKGITVIISEF